MKKLLVLAVALVTAAGISVAIATASPSQGGGLHLKKECSENTGLADTFCTITASNLKLIKVGSRVVYLQAAGTTSLDSDIVLVVGPGNYTFGDFVKIGVPFSLIVLVVSLILVPWLLPL